LSQPRKGSKRKSGRASRYYLVTGVALAIIVIVAGVWWTNQRPNQSQLTSKPIILYVNQGNGAVNGTNFGAMAGFAVAQGFNTVFFQIYREGTLLFSQQELQTFVEMAHSQNLSIFFALYITNFSQQIPFAVLGSGENGVSLDMSTLSLASQESLLASLKGEYGGETAVTTTDMTSPLKPDLLVLETYSPSLQSYIRPGIIGSVGVFDISSKTEYQSEFQYALRNSDGVMVFDYAGLLKSGY